MRILLAAAELSPLARTGGLGEAVAGLAGALADRHDVTVVLPRYQHLAEVGTPAKGPVPLYETSIGGVRVLLFDHDTFDRPGIYGPKPGTAYEDSWARFGAFAKAVAALSSEVDLLHLHDAHPGPAALLTDTPTVMTVHNASYPLIGPLRETADLLGVHPKHRRLGGALEWFGDANFLKAGLVGADRTTTVSPTFARELATDPGVSAGLDEVIRWLDPPIVGILNGIDTDAWDPANDPALAAPFTSGRLGRRDDNREALVAETSLRNGFVVGNVGRMAEQKGIGLLGEHLSQLVVEGFRFVFVGNGELDSLVDGWEAEHPDAVRHLPYEEQLARRVFGGADAYLMPSRFEPCGLGQMYAMRYGAPPVARLTGGLADTVVDLDERPDAATGFGFRLFESVEVAKTLRRARRVHDRMRSDWRRVQRRGMGQDWSWRRAADEYEAIYAAAGS